MQLASKNCLLRLKAEYPVQENVYVLKSRNDVTPQFDKIMPLAPDTVPEISIEPNHGSRNEQLRRAPSLDNLAVEVATKQHLREWQVFDQRIFSSGSIALDNLVQATI